MHDDRKLIEGRVDRVLRERIRPAVYPASVPARIEVWEAPGEPVPVAEGLAADYRPAAVGDAWGPAVGHELDAGHRRGAGAVGGSHRGGADRSRVRRADARLPVRGPRLPADGSAVKGLNPRNQWVRVGSPVAGGEQVTLYVEAAANPVILGDNPFLPTPLGLKETAGDKPLYRIERVDLAVFDTEVWELVADIEVLDQLMRELPEGSTRRWEILRALGRALDAIDLQDVNGTASEGRAELADVLAKPAHASAHRTSAVGHAHIDSAWLWPLRETVRKVARTASNVTALMDEHPEFVFAMS